jgi:hypothetical protein
MNKKTISILLISMILLAVALVSAIDFNPNGDIELRNIWKIKNATSITTQNLTVTDTLTATILNIPIYNSTYDATSADVAANRSLWFSSSNSSYNATYDKWAYNQTAPANAYADSLLTTTYYNVSDINITRGTPQGSLTDINVYDSIPYNISEVGSDLDFYLNFTGITDFNQIIIRYRTIVAETHTLNVQLYDYNSSTWEDYTILSSSGGIYNIVTIGVFDSDEHINSTSGEVILRISDTNLGGSTDKWNFDWVSISKGISTPSGTETDPYSIHKDGTIPLTGNWNAGLFNITANYYFGNLDWTNLTNFPVACPAGSFVSTLGTSSTCTSPSLISGNLNMNANNITNVSYVKYANATSNSAWISYVNATNSFIIEVSS